VQPARDRRADALRRPRHERGFSVQVAVHLSAEF
jgi:hypothetical protein